MPGLRQVQTWNARLGSTPENSKNGLPTMMYSLSILPQASLHVKSVHVEVAGSCAPLAAFGCGGRNRGIYVCGPPSVFSFSHKQMSIAHHSDSKHYRPLANLLALCGALSNIPAIPKDRYPGVELVDFWAGVSPSQLRRDDNSANLLHSAIVFVPHR